MVLCVMALAAAEARSVLYVGDIPLYGLLRDEDDGKGWGTD